MRRAWAVAHQGDAADPPRSARRSLILLFMPAFFLFLYGYALNFDIRHVALAVEDRDESAESRAARGQLRAIRRTSTWSRRSRSDAEAGSR